VLGLSAVVLAAAPLGVSAASSPWGAARVCTSGQIRCLALVVTHDGRRFRAATPAALPAGYGPAQYHTAYHLPALTPIVKTTGLHKNVTVAIVDAYDDATIYQDLTTYSQTFGLPVLAQCSSTVTTSCFQKVNQGAPAGSAVASGWDLEIALDVETVHAICENCKIVLVEGSSDSLISILAAENNAEGRASIVSNSFGSYGDDGSQGVFDTFFNAPGKAIVVASGDSGYGVSWPASLNTVIAVGGTSLTLGANNSYASETVWGPDGTHNWGSGSGCASGAVSGLASVAAQPFQAAVANYANTGCGSFRGDNDVAANADPHTGSAIYASGHGWLQVGGTSLAAPLIAGVFGLKGNAGTATYPASLLYAKAGTPAFNDITTGSDDAGQDPIACNTSTTACQAAPGYDLPTGVGTPHGTNGF
jgi:subtilase family serine protease